MSRTDLSAVVQRLMERKSALAGEAATPPIADRLQSVRAWQALRLARTYADLRRDPLAEDALDFFLSDLYGPRDFGRRDREVARAWRLLSRALPVRMLQVLAMAIELDVLSTELDLEMARRVPAGPLTAKAYAQAYRAVARPDARKRQIALTVAIGTALVRATASPLVGVALRAAHGPAHVAGFGALQDFLERGCGAFRKLPHPTRLLAAIEARESQLMQILLAGGTISGDPSADEMSRSA